MIQHIPKEKQEQHLKAEKIFKTEVLKKKWKYRTMAEVFDYCLTLIK